MTPRHVIDADARPLDVREPWVGGMVGWLAVLVVIGMDGRGDGDGHGRGGDVMYELYWDTYGCSSAVRS